MSSLEEVGLEVPVKPRGVAGSSVALEAPVVVGHYVWAQVSAPPGWLVEMGEWVNASRCLDECMGECFRLCE